MKNMADRKSVQSVRRMYESCTNHENVRCTNHENQNVRCTNHNVNVRIIMYES